METKAKVLYQIPERGAGVEFTDIDPQDRQVFLRIIHLNTANRRQHPRVPLATQIYSEQSMSLAFSRDVTQGGMFVETKQPMPVGSRLTLRFHLDDQGPIVVATAEVRYVLPQLGMGLQFVEMKPEDRKRIAVYASKWQAADDSAEGAVAA